MEVLLAAYCMVSALVTCLATSEQNGKHSRCYIGVARVVTSLLPTLTETLPDRAQPTLVKQWNMTSSPVVVRYYPISLDPCAFHD